MAVVVGAIISAAASIYSSNKKAKAEKEAAASLNRNLDVKKAAAAQGNSLEDVYGKRLEAPQYGLSQADILKITKKLGRYNAGEGTDLANQSASKINDNTLKDLETAMRGLFGGDSYETQRGDVNQIVEDQLAGKLSESTRLLLSRRALASGASGIGPGAVNDLYTGYLGLTTEEITQQGVNNYRSLYSMYRQSFPLTTGLQTLPYTTLTPAAGVNAAIGIAGNQYAADLNSAIAAAAPTPAAAGLIQDELQRSAAVTAARRGAANAGASAIANTGSALGGVVSQLYSQ